MFRKVAAVGADTVIADNLNLNVIDFPTLIFSHSITIQNHPSLQEVNLPELGEVQGQFQILSNGGSFDVAFDKLENSGSMIFLGANYIY